MTRTSWDKVLDRAAIEQVRALEVEGRPSLLEDLVQMYLALSEEALGELKESHSRGDAAAMVAKAHELKSASASLGARGAAQCFMQVEDYAALGNLQLTLKALETLERELATTWRAMRQLLASTS